MATQTYTFDALKAEYVRFEGFASIAPNTVFIPINAWELVQQAVHGHVILATTVIFGCRVVLYDGEGVRFSFDSRLYDQPTFPAKIERVADAPATQSPVIEMQPITNGERSRTYTFPSEYGPQQIIVHNVTHICVRPSGSHRLKTASGRLHIIPKGWLSLTIDADEWSL